MSEDRERRIDEVLGAYLEAREAGEAPTADELIAVHPDLAEELKAFFTDFSFIDGIAEPWRRPACLLPGPGDRFGEYELLEAIGLGGMGVVFRARQASLNRIVAVKMMRSGRLASPAEAERFRAEAEAMAKLNHPGIVTIHEVAERGGLAYFSMEYMGGPSLAELTRKGPLDARQAAGYAEAIAKAIHYAHRKGVLHRDLKPSNVLINDQGDLRITDFGLAKLLEDNEPQTPDGGLVGTLSYMSPEQAQGHGAGIPSDVYAIGALLYELLTGEPPFRGAGVAETLDRVIRGEPTQPRLVNPGIEIPSELEAICLRCLEKQPAQRYHSAADLADDLRRFLFGEPVLATHPQGFHLWLRRRLSRWRGRPALERVGLLAGPLAATLLLLAPSLGFFAGVPAKNADLPAMAAVAAWMAIWWLTTPVPPAVTALLPLVLLPLLGILPGPRLAASYGDSIIFFFLGGFFIALAIENSGLPHRVAFHIVALVGDRPRRIVAGFMLASAVVSMWISNTATVIILLPLATSVASELSTTSRSRFPTVLMLGVAYAASIGGVATLIGTPPNLVLVRLYNADFPEAPITFYNWMVAALPFVFLLLVLSWWLLTTHIFPLGGEPLVGGRATILRRLRALGPMKPAEKRMLAIFTLTVLAWFFREPASGWGWAPALGIADRVTDTTVAVVMAIVCFLVPRGQGEGSLIGWQAASRIPWGVLLIFGGGLALADGVVSSGLGHSLGAALARGLYTIPSASLLVVPIVGLLGLGLLVGWDRRRAPGRIQVGLALACWIGVMVALGFWLSDESGAPVLVAAATTGATELTMNLTTSELLLPVLAETARQMALEPQVLLVPATWAASCAFMLPVATAPNAIVYGSGRVRVIDMVRAGLWLNLTALVVIAVMVAALG